MQALAGLVNAAKCVTLRAAVLMNELVGRLSDRALLKIEKQKVNRSPQSPTANIVNYKW